MTIPSMIFAGILILLVIVFFVGDWLRNPRVEITCVHCESPDVVEVNRELVSSRMVESLGSGSPAGGSLQLQITYELTFRCHACGKAFTRQLVETN
jgi:uncharacterized Zn finger protein